MAATVLTTGPAVVKLDTGAGNTLEILGYSAEGVSIREEARMIDVPGDENGGSEGPPIEIQYLGEIHYVTMELTKLDVAVLNKINVRVYGNSTPGTTSTPGTLMSSNSFRLLILSTTNPRNYLFAIPREPIESNRGTKYMRVSMVFECHSSSDVLWNTTTS